MTPGLSAKQPSHSQQTMTLRAIDPSIEPLSSTPLRRFGVVETASPTIANPEASLVVLTDVYGDHDYQSNLRHLAAVLLDSGAFRLVLVEGHVGPLSASSMAEFGPTLEQKMTQDTRVSPGVLQAVCEAQGDIRTFGIDDPELFLAHRKVQSECNQHRDEWNTFLAMVEARLQTAQNSLPPSVRVVLAYRFPISKPSLALSDFVEAAVPHCNRLRLDFSWFSELAKLRDAIRLESTIDQARCERERTALLTSLVQRLESFRPAPGGTAIDLSKALPLIRFWLTTQGLSEADFENTLAQIGPVTLLRKCESQVLDHLLSSATRYRDGNLAACSFLPDLISLSLRLGVDVFQFPAFHRYVRYVQLAGAVSAQLALAEARELSDQLLFHETLSTSDRAIIELSRRVSLIARAVNLGLVPDEADELLVSDSRWEDLVPQLPAPTVPTSRVPIPPAINKVTAAACEFYRIAERRTEKMVDSTIESLSKEGEHAAVVVCGGFHPRNFIRMITARYTGIAWSILRAELKPHDFLAKHE